MTTLSPIPHYDQFLDFLVEKATPEEILAFKASDETQFYIQDLITRNSEGTLTPEEQEQLEQMLQFERLMSQLKVRALETLDDHR